MFHTNVNYNYFLKQQQINVICVQDLQQILNILTNNKQVKKHLLLSFFLNSKKQNSFCNQNVVFLLLFFLTKTNAVVCLQNTKQCTNVHTKGLLQKFKSTVVLGNVFTFCSKYVIYANNVVFVTFDKILLLSPKYSSSSINKHISNCVVKDVEFQFLRKNKVFNKGRYSRCRQNYRTGVYICMYLSVVCIFGMYFWFYKFSFSFTYLWWVFIAFFGSFFLPKIIKYRLYEPNVIFSKFYGLFFWASKLIKSICG